MPLIGKRTFETVRGSDIGRDGMYLELSETGGEQGIAEIFYSDQTGDFTVNTFGNDIPLEVIEWMVVRARQDLSAVR